MIHYGDELIAHEIMQSQNMLHNIVQFDVAGADSLRISMILLCFYIIDIANWVDTLYVPLSSLTWLGTNGEMF